MVDWYDYTTTLTTHLATLLHSYNLMQSCWDTCPSRRPTAEELVQKFSQANLLYEGGEDDQESESSQQEELTCNNCNSHRETQV